MSGPADDTSDDADDDEITPELLAAILTERAVGAAAERAAVVAWLRGQAGSQDGIDELASAIEAGDHVTGEFR